MLWSSARVCGSPVATALPTGASYDDFRAAVERDVRYANITIIEGNDASQFGIGIVSNRIAEAVLRDEQVVLPIGAYNADYGVTITLPTVVGRNGAGRIYLPAMNDAEHTPTSTASKSSARPANASSSRRRTSRNRSAHHSNRSLRNCCHRVRSLPRRSRAQMVC